MQYNQLLSKDNTLILKGYAILLMISHHLFYSPQSANLFWDYHFEFASRDIGIVNYLGLYGKLCVAKFVFASGYGLESTYLNKDLNAFAFYKRDSRDSF